MSDIQQPRFSAESLELVEKIKKRYPEGKQRSALLPVLHIAQAEFGGWLSAEVMDYVASLLDLKPIEVYEVATFYTMYNLEPVGNCVIEVCQTGPCQLKGAGEIIRHFESKLGIKVGETTPDGKFTLRGVECLAACGTAPVMKVGWTYHENLSTEKVDEFLAEQLQSGQSSHVNPYQ
ncbi:complex I 24 kDa subunit family protein [Alistipes sp. ZOR0009]|uniref:NADH-quinone oxidoreductase subunit NuoE family protein n=1 Tax=Alistipes sp. ZOR0009 TaxID=1339253 RepID=UPI000646F35C|nr:NAD(P)H-dependent oxidoreductase subunit E [Alistipes sp. ZOR0009]